MPKNYLRHQRAFAIAIALLVVVGVVFGVRFPVSSAASANDKPVVITTFTVLADMIRNVAGEHVRVESITKIGAEIHGYEPTPGDLRRAAGADLAIDNGLGLEAWFSQFIDTLDIPHVVVSEGVTPIAIAGGEAAGKANPHAWMSPTVARQYVENIVAALSDLAPEHAADFRANADAYLGEIATVRDELVAELAGLPERSRILVTCEGRSRILPRTSGSRRRTCGP